MNILIIGGTRFLGRFIVSELGSRGHQVVVFHRGVTEVESPSDPVAQVPHVHGDRTVRADLDRVLEGGFDAVVDVDPRNDTNVGALLDLARDRCARLLLVSSIHVYSGIHGGETQLVPFDEDRSAIREAPLFPYRGLGIDLDDFDAVLLERAALDRGLGGRPAVTMLRMPVIYGPHDNFSREYPWIRAVRDGRRTLAMGWGACHIRQRIFVADAARAVALALETEACAGRIFNVGEWAVRPVAHVAIDVAQVLGRTIDVIVVPDLLLPPHLAFTSRLAQHWWSDTQRFRSATGFVEGLPYEERLQQTVEWHLQHPPPDGYWIEPDYPEEDQLLAMLTPESKADTAGDAGGGSS
jgi:nucleoside-diphosphate-sugar epimerase